MSGRSHSPYSPSSAFRWMHCSASVALSLSAETLGLGGGDSRAARTGTVAMAILERMLPRDGDPGASFKDALMLACAEGVVDITEVEADMQPALERAVQVIAPYALSASHYDIEALVNIPQIPTSGHVDFYAVFLEPGKEKIVVIDYKHGEGLLVEAKKNPQLLLYAAGVADMFNLISPSIQVTLIVIQPRHVAGGVKIWTTTLGEVLAFADEAGARARSQTYKTGDHCRFCAAAPICGLRIKEMEAAASYDPEAVVHDASGEIMASVLDKARRVKDFIDRTEKAAIARLMAGRDVPGWALGEGPGRLVWKSGAEEALVAAYGERAYEKSLLSPAQVRDTMPDGTALVAQHAFRRPGKPTLKPKGT